jgi:hypothetical protein
VKSITKGKHLIRAFRDEDKYIVYLNKWIDDYTNIKGGSSLLGQWVTQRFQLVSLGLLVFMLMVATYRFESLGMDSKTLSLIIAYCVDLSTSLGHFVKSMIAT